MNSRIFSALLWTILVLFCNVHIAEAEYKNRLTVSSTTNPVDWPYSIDLGQLIQNSLIRAFQEEAHFHLLPASAKKFESAKKVSGKKSSSEKKYRGLMHPAKFDVVSRLIHVELDQAPPPARKILTPGGYRQTARLILDVDLVAHHTGRSIAHQRFQTSSRSGSEVVDLNQLPEDFSYDQLNRTSLGSALESMTKKIMVFVNHHLYSRPLEGETLMVDSKKREAIISLGNIHGVKIGDLFDVFGVTLKFQDPFSQIDLGDKYDRRGVLRIKDVQEMFSTGEIVAGKELWEGDLARSRKYNRLPLGETISARAKP